MNYLDLLKKYKADPFSLSFSDEIISNLCFLDYKNREIDMLEVVDPSNDLLTGDEINWADFDKNAQLICEIQISLCIKKLKDLENQDPKLYPIIEEFYIKDLDYKGNYFFPKKRSSFLKQMEIDIPNIPAISNEDSMRITQYILYGNYLKLKSSIVDENIELIQMFGLDEKNSENSGDFFYGIGHVVETTKLDFDILSLRRQKFHENFMNLKKVFPVEYQILKLHSERHMKLFHVVEKFVKRS